MTIVPKDELEDAIQAAEKYGYGESDFTARYIEYSPLRRGPAPIVADVEITHTSRGITKTYHAGDGSTWPADFARDVEAGQFGVIIGRRRVRACEAVQWVHVRSAGSAGHCTKFNRRTAMPS